MSKNTRRRSIRLESLQNDSHASLNHASRSPRNSSNTQFRKSLQNRNKLDITFTKVNKVENDGQLPRRSIFRADSFFGPRITSDHSKNSGKMELPNTSNSISNQRVSENMEQNQSSNVSSSNISQQFPVPEPSTTFGGRNSSPDSSSTFFEPDSTVEDDLGSDLIFDSNGPIDESVLIENMKPKTSISDKSSLERETGKVTQKKNLSVKKLTQHKPESVKTKTSTPQKTKTVVRRTKSTNGRKSLANSNQDSLLGEISVISTISSHQNSSKKSSTVCKQTNPTNKAVTATKSSNLEKLSQHHLPTPMLSNPAINTKLSSSKSKPKNSPLLCKKPPTPKPNSKARTVSPELFVSDHDNNQAFSSNDLVLPSPDDLTKLGRTVSRNRLETPRGINSASIAPVTNSSQQVLRYPLRSSTSTPVIYDLPVVHRIKSNSSSVLSKLGDSSSQTSVSSRSKIPNRKSTILKPFPNINAQLGFSQCSSVHESLLNISTPRDTPNDVYNFVSTSPPRKSQTRKKKEVSCLQKARTSRSTPVKKTIQFKPNCNPLPAAVIEPRKNVTTRKTPQTPKSKMIFNASAFSDLTNQTPRKTRSASKNAANKDNFLSGTFSQLGQTSSQQLSMFSSFGSQTSGNFTNSNFSLNSHQTFFNQTNTPVQNQRNYSRPFGYGNNILAYIDNMNQNNDSEMEDLCNLFSQLKIDGNRNLSTSSFLTYRDPNLVEKPYVKKIVKREKPIRKISLLGNTFMNYRASSKPIVEENETPFSPIPTLKRITNGIHNLLPFEHVVGAPAISHDATKSTNLSARTLIKGVNKISRKVPNNFYADGEYSFDGFSNWK